MQQLPDVKLKYFTAWSSIKPVCSTSVQSGYGLVVKLSFVRFDLLIMVNIEPPRAL